MTLERQDILQDFYSGNTKKLRLTIVDSTGAPKDLTGGMLTFALFEDRTEVVVLEKSSATPDTRVGFQITLDTPAQGICTIHLWPADTASLDGAFRYHVNLIDADGYEETVTTGRLYIFKAFAKRPRKINQPAYLLGG